MTVHDQGGALDSIGIKETRVTQSTRVMLLHLPHEIQIESQVVGACDPEELPASRRPVLRATNALRRCAPLDERIVDYKCTNPRARAAPAFYECEEGA